MRIEAAPRAHIQRRVVRPLEVGCRVLVRQATVGIRCRRIPTGRVAVGVNDRYFYRGVVVRKARLADAVEDASVGAGDDDVIDSVGFEAGGTQIDGFVRGELALERFGRVGATQSGLAGSGDRNERNRRKEGEGQGQGY